jgi:hypothetical protein
MVYFLIVITVVWAFVKMAGLGRQEDLE